MLQPLCTRRKFATERLHLVWPLPPSVYVHMRHIEHISERNGPECEPTRGTPPRAQTIGDAGQRARAARQERGGARTAVRFRGAIFKPFSTSFDTTKLQMSCCVLLFSGLCPLLEAWLATRQPPRWYHSKRTVFPPLCEESACFRRYCTIPVRAPTRVGPTALRPSP